MTSTGTESFAGTQAFEHAGAGHGREAEVEKHRVENLRPPRAGCRRPHPAPIRRVALARQMALDGVPEILGILHDQQAHATAILPTAILARPVQAGKRAAGRSLLAGDLGHAHGRADVGQRAVAKETSSRCASGKSLKEGVNPAAGWGRGR